MKKLIIAEKEELAKSIVKYLESTGNSFKKEKLHYDSNEWIVAYASGHLLTLKSPEEYNEALKKWEKKTLPIFFENWEAVPKEGEKARSLLANIKKLLASKDIREIYHAGDPDDEGQYLIDEILKYYGNKKPVKRLLINDTTVGGIKKSFDNIKNNEDFISNGESAYARAVADYMVGINYSRFFTLNNRAKTLSVGRVQTPTLAMIVNRDYEVENHVQQKYYELFTKLKVIKNSNNNEKIMVEKYKQLYLQNFHDKDLANKYFAKMINNFAKLNENYICSLKYSLPEHRKEEFPDGKITNKVIIDELQTLIKFSDLVLKVKKDLKKSQPPLPFNLARLQIFCSQKFDYSPDEVLQITQALRDKYNAITYNRSDCEYLTDEQFSESQTTVTSILKNLGISVPEIDFSRKSKAFNDKNITAHTAIIPTSTIIDISSFSEKERNVYQTIADFYLIQFLPPVLIEQTTVTLNLLDEEDFKRTSNKILELGYKAYLRDNLNDENNEENFDDDITSLIEGEYSVSIIDTHIDEKLTSPPKYYTEGAIIKDMCSISKYVTDSQIKELLKSKDKGKKGENGSIGTPATRAGIIKTLYDRGFIQKDKKVVKSTKLGRELISILPNIVTTPNLTALWWAKQENIKDGSLSVNKFLKEVLDDIKNVLATEHKSITSVISQDKESFGLCPVCGKEIYKGQTKEKKSNYYCSGYKDGCNFQLYQEMKHYQNILKLSDSIVKKLLKNEPVEFQLTNSKTGKEYTGKLKIKINNVNGKNYINFENYK